MAAIWDPLDWAGSDYGIVRRGVQSNGNLWQSLWSNITFLKEHNDEINSKLELQSNKDNLQKSILFFISTSPLIKPPPSEHPGA